MLAEELKLVNPASILTVHLKDGSIYCPDNAGTFLTIQKIKGNKLGIAVWLPRGEEVPIRVEFWVVSDIKKVEFRPDWKNVRRVKNKRIKVRS